MRYIDSASEASFDDVATSAANCSTEPFNAEGRSVSVKVGDSGLRISFPELGPEPNPDGSNWIKMRFDISGRTFVATAVATDPLNSSDAIRTAAHTALMYVDLRLRLPPLEFDVNQLQDIAQQAQLFSGVGHRIVIRVEEINRQPVHHVLHDQVGSDWIQDILPTTQVRDAPDGDGSVCP